MQWKWLATLLGWRTGGAHLINRSHSFKLRWNITIIWFRLNTVMDWHMCSCVMNCNPKCRRLALFINAEWPATAYGFESTEYSNQKTDFRNVELTRWTQDENLIIEHLLLDRDEWRLKKERGERWYACVIFHIHILHMCLQNHTTIWNVCFATSRFEALWAYVTTCRRWMADK